MKRINSSKLALSLTCILFQTSAVKANSVDEYAIGFIETLTKEWRVEEDSLTEYLTPQIINAQPILIASGNRYTALTDGASISYIVCEGKKPVPHTKTLDKNESFTVNSKITSECALELKEKLVEKTRGHNTSKLLLAKTRDLEEGLLLSWADFEAKQTLKKLTLNGEKVSISATGQSILLPITADTDTWEITLSNDHRYQRKVKRLSAEKIAAIEQEVNDLMATMTGDKNKALASAFVFQQHGLHLLSWEIFDQLYQEYKTPIYQQFRSATEQLMGCTCEKTAIYS